MQSLSRQACHNVTQHVEVLDPADKKERVSVFITVARRKRQGPRFNITGLFGVGRNFFNITFDFQVSLSASTDA